MSVLERSGGRTLVRVTPEGVGEVLGIPLHTEKGLVKHGAMEGGLALLATIGDQPSWLVMHAGGDVVPSMAGLLRHEGGYRAIEPAEADIKVIDSAFSGLLRANVSLEHVWLGENGEVVQPYQRHGGPNIALVRGGEQVGRYLRWRMAEAKAMRNEYEGFEGEWQVASAAIRGLTLTAGTKRPSLVAPKPALSVMFGVVQPATGIYSHFTL